MFTPRCVLVTGGAGFIGATFVRWLLDQDAELRVVNLDALTYAGNLERLDDVFRHHGGSHGRHYFIRADIRDFHSVHRVLTGRATETPGPRATARQIPRADAVVHMAAESHVDRSIMGPARFVETNVMGTFTLLEACRAAVVEHGLPFRFLHVSTDEVYGSLQDGDPPFTEDARLSPNSPYSASKAGSDCLVRS